LIRRILNKALISVGCYNIDVVAGTLVMCPILGKMITR
jgi:hypothetical protein